MPVQFLVAFLSIWLNRRQQVVIEYLKEENRVLREQLADKRLRFTDAQRKRLAEKGRALGRAALMQLATIATPDTILRWYRNLVAAKYDGTVKRGLGRPRAVIVITDLILKMGRENPGWGYTRIRGALANLGHEVGRSTIKRTLIENGLDPAPERSKRTSWSTFLKSHMGAIAAADFFTVEVLGSFGLTCYWVLFVMDIKRRDVYIAGITNQPHDAWMNQIARNLTDGVEGFLKGIRYLIIDRDPLYSAAFRSILKESGVSVVRLPSRSPNLNSFAERFVRSIKSECLSRIIPLGERHLRHLISEYMGHYHCERNHHGVDNCLLIPAPSCSNTNGPVLKRERLGGVLNYYYRDAA